MLAQHRGLSTTELMALAVETNAPILRNKEDGFCVFYQAGLGCTVHPARPLVCRLYPLGMQRRNEAISFSQLEAHPQSEGIYGTAGTVADFVASQGVAEYLDKMEAYLGLVKDLYASWSARSEDKTLPNAESYQPDLLDIDRVLPGENQRDPPYVKASRHIEALRARLSAGELRTPSEPAAETLGAALSTLVAATGITISARSQAAAPPGTAPQGEAKDSK